MIIYEDCPDITYSFEEILERILSCDNREDLKLYGAFLKDNLRDYCIIHMRLLKKIYCLKMNLI